MCSSSIPFTLSSNFLAEGVNLSDSTLSSDEYTPSTSPVWVKQIKHHYRSIASIRSDLVTRYINYYFIFTLSTVLSLLELDILNKRDLHCLHLNATLAVVR